MTGPSSAAPIARSIVEAALLRLTEPECSCEGEAVCQTCAAVEALEMLARAEFIAGMVEAKGVGDAEP